MIEYEFQKHLVEKRWGTEKRFVFLLTLEGGSGEKRREEKSISNYVYILRDVSQVFLL